MTTLTSVLEQRLSESVGDYIEVIVTTAINADNLVVSTNLNAYDYGEDDYFIDWWCYITDKANLTVNRQVSDYATSTGQLTLRGATLIDDVANLATIRLHRYNRDLYINAINDAARELYPSALHKKLDVIELSTGDWLQNSHFRDWASSSNPDKWATVAGTLMATTTAGLYRGGAKSMKVTAGGAADYAYQTSDTNTRLLDLMGTTVHGFAWAYPEVANDATIMIYTQQADGTEQTESSTTSCPADEWTLLTLKNVTLNDDLVDVQFRLYIATNLKYVYFDHARLTGKKIYEYLMPTDFRNGHVSRYFLQADSYSAEFVDDIHPRSWQELFGCTLVEEYDDEFFRINPSEYSAGKLLRLTGHTPLETVSAYTSTVSLDGEQVNLLIAYAKYKLYQAIEGPVSSKDVVRYERESAKAYAEYKRLKPALGMTIPSGSMRLPVY